LKPFSAKEARKIVANTEDEVNRKRRKDVDDQGFTYTWSTEQKVRPGLNVFDEKGNELEWDYEHDTRFYDDPNASLEKDDSKSTETDSAAPQAKIVRGRGAKKGSQLYNGLGHTLASDDLDTSVPWVFFETIMGEFVYFAQMEERKRRRLAGRVTSNDDRNEDESDEETWHQMPSAPTPQPWDRLKGRLANRVTRP
ncbi:unnamed protein product, partial [Strongylus vulgaris]